LFSVKGVENMNATIKNVQFRSNQVAVNVKREYLRLF